MLWGTFFGLNFLGLVLIGYMSTKGMHAEGDDRTAKIFHAFASALVCFAIGGGNLYYLMKDYDAVSMLERVPWLLGVGLWGFLLLLAVIPEKTAPAQELGRLDD